MKKLINLSQVNNGNTPPAKKPRLETFEVCRACLGVLQESLMQPTLEMVTLQEIILLRNLIQIYWYFSTTWGMPIFDTSRVFLMAFSSWKDPFYWKVCRDVRNSGYDADHFTIAVSLPVSLSLRSHSLNLYLEEKVPHFDPDQVVPIKQVKSKEPFWRWHGSLTGILDIACPRRD